MREVKFRAWDKYQKVMYVSPCPGAQNYWPGCGGTTGECSSDQVGCWKKYFLEEVDHDTP